MDVPIGHAVTVVVEQFGTDLALTLSQPHGQIIQTIDMRERGPESVTVIGHGSGPSSITLHAIHQFQAPAAFEIQMAERPHRVTNQDHWRQMAERLETQGKALAIGPPPGRDSALPVIEKALELWRKIDDAIGTGTTLARIGDLHLGAGRFEQAEAAYSQALTSLRPLNNRFQLGMIENNLAGTHERRGQFREAIAHVDAAREIWNSGPGAGFEMAVTLATEGSIRLQYGDYQIGVDRLLSALPALEGAPHLRATVLNNLGTAYRALGNHGAARQYLERAADAMPAGDPRQGRLRLRLAQLLLDSGASAEVLVREHVAALDSPRVDPIARADALHVLGQALAAAKRFGDALGMYKQALDLYEQTGARRGVAAALHDTGIVQRLMQRFAPAREALTRALAIRRIIGLHDSEAETLYELGMLEAEVGHLARARSHFADAINLIEQVRGRVAGEYSRVSYFGSRRKYFAGLTDVLMQFNGRDPGIGYASMAFDVSERERARALIDLIRESGADVRQRVDTALLARAADAQRQLDFWAARVATLANQQDGEAAAADARQRMDRHLTEYREVEARIRAAAATEASITNPAILTLPNIQRELLDARTRLVRFSLGESGSYAWLVGPNSFKVAVLPPRGEIEAAAGRVVELMRTPRTVETAAALRHNFEREARELASILLAPFAGDLEDHRLLIVCDGMLQLVPFGALPEPHSGEPLVVRHEIAMLPSASAIATLRRQHAQRPPASKMIAVLADPVYELDDPRLAGRGGPRGDEERPFDVSRLMLSGLEGAAVLRFASPEDRFGAFGFEATREALLTRFADYRIVHVAAHAVADNVRPELSALILSRFDAQGRTRDGVLRLHEIAGSVTLRAEVVVLSACSTALGPDLPGEGLMGLARAFLGAGAASVIGTLHTVQDEPTLELMEAFYDGMLGRRRLRPAAALRAAQMKMLASARFADPFFWSSFVFVGDPR